MENDLAPEPPSDPEPPLDPPRKRSNCARALSCLALAILIAVAAALTAKPLLSRAPTLILDQGEASLLYPGYGSVPLVLGPGCSDLELKEDWDSLEHASLSWLAEGKACQIPVRRISGPRGVWRPEIGDEWPEKDQVVVLLPTGRLMLSDASRADLVLEVQRWEGSPGAGKRYVVWLYRDLRLKHAPRVATWDDGRSMGRLTGSSQSTTSWRVEERYQSGVRSLDVTAGKEFGTFRVEDGGKTEEVVLERAFHGEWSPGDVLPE